MDYNLSKFILRLSASTRVTKQLNKFLLFVFGSNNAGLCAKVECKYDDGKRVESEFRDSKEELFGYQTDNIDDLTDDDDEVSFANCLLYLRFDHAFELCDIQ